MRGGLAKLEFDRVEYSVTEPMIASGLFSQMAEKSDALLCFTLPATGESVPLDAVLAWQDMTVELKSISCEELTVDGTEYVDYAITHTALDGWQPELVLTNLPFKAPETCIYNRDSGGGVSETRVRFQKSRIVPNHVRIEELSVIMLSSKCQTFDEIAIDIPA